MENFAILTDAGGDFTREVLKKYGIEETPTSTVVWPDGSEKPTDLYYETISVEDYFSLMTLSIERTCPHTPKKVCGRACWQWQACACRQFRCSFLRS